MTLEERILFLESELASERALTADLRKKLERMKAEAFDGFDRLAAERDAALTELRRLRKQAPDGPISPLTPNMPPESE